MAVLIEFWGRPVGGPLNAPSDPAILTRVRRFSAEKLGPEFLIKVVVPYIHKRPLERVAKDYGVVITFRKRGDTTREHVPVGRDVHESPGPAAQGPGIVLVARHYALLGRSGAGRVNRDGKIAGQLLRAGDRVRLILVQRAEQPLAGPGQSLALLGIVKENEPLEGYLAHS